MGVESSVLTLLAVFINGMTLLLEVADFCGFNPECVRSLTLHVVSFVNAFLF